MHVAKGGYKVRIEAISAFDDNYIWAIIQGEHAWVVDPGDASQVIKYLKSSRLHLEGILITHHHFDHIGGVDQLSREFEGCTIKGPHGLSIESDYQGVADADRFSLFDTNVTVTAVPGHTLDHIAYCVGSHLFCGDTLFSAGCGRIFEGTPAQMYDSIKKLASIECDFIYPTHEYTLANLEFCMFLEPNNEVVTSHYHQVLASREEGKPSLPTNWVTEHFINPYLRCDNDGLRDAVSDITKHNIQTEIELFTLIRGLKDQF